MSLNVVLLFCLLALCECGTEKRFLVSNHAKILSPKDLATYSVLIKYVQNKVEKRQYSEKKNLCYDKLFGQFSNILYAGKEEGTGDLITFSISLNSSIHLFHTL